MTKTSIKEVTERIVNSFTGVVQDNHCFDFTRSEKSVIKKFTQKAVAGKIKNFNEVLAELLRLFDTSTPKLKNSFYVEVILFNISVMFLELWGCSDVINKIVDRIIHKIKKPFHTHWKDGLIKFIHITPTYHLKRSNNYEQDSSLSGRN